MFTRIASTLCLIFAAATTALAQQQAENAVVGAEVEAAQARRGAEHRPHLGELALLQDRAAEEGGRPLPRGEGLSHGAPRGG